MPNDLHLASNLPGGPLLTVGQALAAFEARGIEHVTIACGHGLQLQGTANEIHYVLQAFLAGGEPHTQLSWRTALERWEPSSRATTRLWNCLSSAGLGSPETGYRPLSTLADLVAFGRIRLSRERNAGRHTITQAEALLAHYGLKF